MAKIDKLLERAREHFDEEERPLQAVCGAYETKIMGKDTVRNGIFIATDHRLLFYGKKWTGYDLEILPYEYISSMEMGVNWMGHYISFFAQGNSCKMKWISEGNARAYNKMQGDARTWVDTNVRAFVDTVKTQMARKSRRGTAAPSPEQPTAPIDQRADIGRAEGASPGLPSSEQQTDPLDQLERLGKLHAAGVLTDEEFSAEKAKILARL